MIARTAQRLPLGISTFRDIIQDDYVYVDKTEYIYRLVTGGRYYFLSRPRRFGKSLLVSTLAELFSGNKELFKDLWIAKSDYAWQSYPVIRFDFSSIEHATAKELRLGLYDELVLLAQQHHVNIDSQVTAAGKFKLLVEQLARRGKVIILVDEYDKPILDHIDDSQEAKKQREVLKSFYTVIKSVDKNLKFVLLTGVSKFAKTSIFSGINNLRDISLSSQYATLLGYTHQELHEKFALHLEQAVPDLGETVADISKCINDNYDGYRFARNAEPVLNPYSVLTCLVEHTFGNYWFASGTPTFLVKMVQKNNYRPEALIGPVLNERSLGSFEPDNIPLPALLFQTGYLTIKEYDAKTGNYVLGIPNREVDSGLTMHLADAFTQLSADESLQYARVITHAFMRCDMPELQQKLQDFFNRMPYTVHVTDEYKLQFVLYAIFALIGVVVDPEVTTKLGRADLIVTLRKQVYVIELKFNKSADVALAQIQDKKYYEKYENTGKQITLLGINFDRPTKTISLEWQHV